MRINVHFPINGFVSSLAFKQRLGATRKWPIDANCVDIDRKSDCRTSAVFVRALCEESKKPNLYRAYVGHCGPCVSEQS